MAKNEIPQPWWWQDLFSSPRWQLMNATERGAYMTLLGLQWLNNGKGLPSKDRNVLKRLAGVDRRKPNFDLVMSCFEEDKEGRLVNRKSQQQWEEAMRYRDEQASRGRLGGRPRKSHGFPGGNPDESHGFSGVESHGLAGEKPSKSPREEEKEKEKEKETPDTSEEEEPTPARLQRVEDVPIPPELDTEGFRAAWFDKWLPWRRASKPHGKNQPVTVRAAQEQLAKLAPYGPGRACMAIGQSISNDWQGLFPEKLLDPNGHRVKPRHAGSRIDPATEALLEEIGKEEGWRK